MYSTLFKEFRSRHDLTQQELGLQLGMEEHQAQSRISHYESERRELPKHVAYAFMDLAKAFGETVTLEDLYPRPLKTA